MLKTYANSLRLKEEQESFLKLYDELFAMPANVAEATLNMYAALAENTALQNTCRTELAKATITDQLLKETNAQAIADYETAVNEIKSRHGGASYEEDIDYLKLNIVNEKLLNTLEKNNDAVIAAELALKEAVSAASRIESEKALLIEEAALKNQRNAEGPLLNAFLKQQAEALIPDEEGNYDEEAVLPGWQAMNEEFVEKMNDSRWIYRPPSSGGGSGGSGSGKSSSGGSSSGVDMDDFKEWLKKEDPDSYKFYKELEESWN